MYKHTNHLLNNIHLFSSIYLFMYRIVLIIEWVTKVKVTHSSH